MNFCISQVCLKALLGQLGLSRISQDRLGSQGKIGSARISQRLADKPHTDLTFTPMYPDISLQLSKWEDKKALRRKLTKRQKFQIPMLEKKVFDFCITAITTSRQKFLVEETSCHEKMALRIDVMNPCRRTHEISKNRQVWTAEKKKQDALAGIRISAKPAEA